MRKRVLVTPVEGRVVRDPKHSRVLPKEGSEVVASSYWYRLALDGDVVMKGWPPPATDEDPVADPA